MLIVLRRLAVGFCTFAIAKGLRPSSLVLLSGLASVGTSLCLTHELQAQQISYTPDCTVTVLDNSTPGFTASGTWHSWSSGGYLGSIRYTQGSQPSAEASYTFSNLDAGTYSIAATTFNHSALARDSIPFEISINDQVVGLYLFNQRNPLASNSFVESGHRWSFVASTAFSITAGDTLKVVIKQPTNVAPSAAVIADAVRVQNIATSHTGDSPIPSLVEEPTQLGSLCETPPESCPVYNVNVIYPSFANAYMDENYAPRIFPLVELYGGAREGETCLRQALDAADVLCRNIQPGDWSGNGPVNSQYPKCVALTFLYPRSFVNAPHGIGCNSTNIGYYSDAIYFDSQCNAICNRASVDQNQVCDIATIVYNTPISFAWDTDTEPSQHEYRVVSFPLDPAKPGASYLWKASGKWPLLVYDPEHSGEITSGTQLFGNWTFGGQSSDLKRTALNSQSESARPWEHGFAALATLDANRNGKIDGAELLPLGIWFDENQDGVSQPGEVKALSEVGITALYYNVDRRDESSKSLYVDKGFEISRDGISRSGALIDWYAETAESLPQLLHGTTLSRPNIRGADSAEQLTENSAAPVTAQLAAEQVSELPDVSGAWYWRVDEKSAKTAGSPQGGVLILLDHGVTEGNRVEGKTLVDLPFTKRYGDYSGAAIQRELVGMKTLDQATRQTALEFSFIKPGSESDDKTRAVLDATGKILTGTTVETLAANEAGKPTRVVYSWTAVRR